MKLEEVKKGYTKSAIKYDKRLNFWFGKALRIEKYRKEAVGWLELKKAETVLDIGCGTGANFSLIEEKIGAEGKIIGLDYTDAMLREAEEKIKKREWNNITLIQGDAVRVDELVNTEVDAIISTYCFGILYDLEKAFLNALKVLKPNGRVVIIDVRKVKHDNKLLRMLYPIYAAMFRKYGIASAQDLDEKIAVKKLKLFQKVTRENLVNVKQKEFLFNMFFILRGEKK